jgi:hypothetical protein
MALPTGTITINDLATEYGGSTPHSLSEYYRKTANDGYVDHTRQTSAYSVPNYQVYARNHATNAGFQYWYWNGTLFASYTWAGRQSFVSWGGDNYSIGALQSTEAGGKAPDTYTDYRYTIWRLVFVNQGVPTSGTISLDDFRGESGN